MCGITGYVGDRPAVKTAIKNLKRLEYRGYDSSGVAYSSATGIEVRKSQGKIANLESLIGAETDLSTVAISHTRWATHGRPNEVNAHPHKDCSGKIAVVHNGIVENYAILRQQLKIKGHEFISDTDTEVISHLIEDKLPASDQITAKEFLLATRQALKELSGSFAVGIISDYIPNAVFVARKDSPLVIGLGEGENFIASDIPAVMAFTRRVIVMEDGDCAYIERNSVDVFNLDGERLDRNVLDVTWDDISAEKGGFDHFMLKEIFEEPRTVRDTLRGHILENNRVELPEVKFTTEQWNHIRRITIVGCGTAFHAGLVGKRLLEQLIRRPVEAIVASEFRYSDPIVDDETLVILISQSGETADTLAAMREARKKGAHTLGIVNVVGSTLSREADAILYTQAGPEIGVASTKAYLAQLVALSLLAIYLSQDHLLTEFDRNKMITALKQLPEQIEEILGGCSHIEDLARRLSSHSCFFFLGRSYDYAASMEAALKLKEISYIHAEAYAAGEMKHGPLALVEPGVSIIGLCTQPATNEKMISNLKEVKAREGTITTVIRKGDEVPDCADEVIEIPITEDALMPVLAMVPLQLLSYYFARERGCSIDQPRNLAKSVTVE